MKKILLLSIILLGFTFICKAQHIADNAIGLRLGDSDGFGAEVSYQRLLWENNRLEVDLGWRNGDDFSAIRLLGLYQWVWLLDQGFNWYTGIGAGLASFDIDLPNVDSNSTSFIIAGNIGLEYNFDIPLIVALDFRPELGFGNFNDDLDFDIGLSFRYQF